MNIEKFIAKRIISDTDNKEGFSKPIVRISIFGITLSLVVMILTVTIITGIQDEIKNKVIGFDSHIKITNYDANESN
jgi:lipoprotein-releasing system permease protein